MASTSRDFDFPFNRLDDGPLDPLPSTSTDSQQPMIKFQTVAEQSFRYEHVSVGILDLQVESNYQSARTYSKSAPNSRFDNVLADCVWYGTPEAITAYPFLRDCVSGSLRLRLDIYCRSLKKRRRAFLRSYQVILRCTVGWTAQLQRRKKDRWYVSK